MSDEFSEWLTTTQASKLTGYSAQYLRRIVRQGRIKAHKWSNAWMIDRLALLNYKQEMDSLGLAKHDPWRTGSRQKDDKTD